MAHARARPLSGHRGLGARQGAHPCLPRVCHVPPREAAPSHRLAICQPPHEEMPMRVRAALVPAANVPQGRLDVLARPDRRVSPRTFSRERRSLLHFCHRDTPPGRPAPRGVLQHAGAQLRMDELPLLLHRSPQVGRHSPPLPGSHRARAAHWCSHTALAGRLRLLLQGRSDARASATGERQYFLAFSTAGPGDRARQGGARPHPGAPRAPRVPDRHGTRALPPHEATGESPRPRRAPLATPHVHFAGLGTQPVARIVRRARGGQRASPAARPIHAASPLRRPGDEARLGRQGAALDAVAHGSEMVGAPAYTGDWPRHLAAAVHAAHVDGCIRPRLGRGPAAPPPSAAGSRLLEPAGSALAHHVQRVSRRSPLRAALPALPCGTQGRAARRQYGGGLDPHELRLAFASPYARAALALGHSRPPRHCAAPDLYRQRSERDRGRSVAHGSRARLLHQAQHFRTHPTPLGSVHSGRVRLGGDRAASALLVARAAAQRGGHRRLRTRVAGGGGGGGGA
mmetsp:Transcript_43889/g.100519  ORF Transcript_43889/g.100519 Transcript_43889/m.100519 type:complete len:514 (+) Transcript_43889:1598-3139(+)